MKTKYFDMWTGRLIPKSKRERVLKELNPVPLISSRLNQGCDYDLDEKRVPPEWYKRLWAAAIEDGIVEPHHNQSLPIGFSNSALAPGICIQQVKRTQPRKVGGKE